MRIQCGSLVFLSLLAITDTCVQAQAESPLVRQQPTVVAVDELDRKLLAVYERVNSTVVRFEYLDGEVSGGGTGVIVTEEGHILVKYVGPLAAEATLTIQLADGRRVAGLVRGQSQECGVTMLLLDQPGPWPHVDLAQSESVKSGQCLVNLKFPLNDKANVIPRPLLTVSRVTVSSLGWWFLSSEVGKNWDTSGVAFDLNGQCSGIQTFSNASSGQCAYTETKLLYSLINDLIPDLKNELKIYTKSFFLWEWLRKVHLLKKRETSDLPNPDN